ncbi:MAG: hypothetical protein MPJ22_08765, partial [Pirellulales bacterium]|nr:hypothetical protein [Pirellulales bacterium]
NRRSAFGISGRLTKTFTMLAQANSTNLCLRAPPAAAVISSNLRSKNATKCKKIKKSNKFNTIIMQKYGKNYCNPSRNVAQI